MTKEQEKISRRNYYRTAKMLDLKKGYCLHHVNEELKHTDIERYIQWNPEDLVVWTRGQHSRYHSSNKSDEWKRRISESKKGHETSKDTRDKIAKTLSSKGMHWYNNGEREINTAECPDGFVRGRLKRKRDK